MNLVSGHDVPDKILTGIFTLWNPLCMFSFVKFKIKWILHSKSFTFSSYIWEIILTTAKNIMISWWYVENLCVETTTRHLRVNLDGVACPYAQSHAQLNLQNTLVHLCPLSHIAHFFIVNFYTFIHCTITLIIVVAKFHKVKYVYNS